MTTELKTITIPAHTDLRVVVYGGAKTIELVTVPELGVAITIKSDVMKEELFEHKDRALFCIKLATSLFTLVERNDPTDSTRALCASFVNDVEPVDTAMLENLRVLEVGTINSKYELEVVVFEDAKYEPPGVHDILAEATEDEVISALDKILGTSGVKVVDDTKPATNGVDAAIKPTLH